MTFLLTLLYCLLGSLWACYWLEEICHGLYLDSRMWRYLWHMTLHITFWPVNAPYWLWYRGYWPGYRS